MKRILTIMAASLLAMAGAAEAQAQIVVSADEAIGPIKYMNAVNNGPSPVFEWQSMDNMTYFKNLRIPYARTHDSTSSGDYGDTVVDITKIFPDFSKDVNDPASYDFFYTDRMMLTLQRVGTKPFYRLGQTIENGNGKKYDIFPPADFKKWAQICEHIIRHYNYGWADGYEMGIEYWEIWNEPDNDFFTKMEMSETWGGTEKQFLEFYATAAKHLKKCFPELKIGGPATTRCNDWIIRFFDYMSKHKVPVDFFSWHLYDTHPEGMASLARKARTIADEGGYPDAESILDEWNYIKGWDVDYAYSMSVIHEIKGAAFTSAVMTACQYEPVDMLMYYDAQSCTPYNGLFDFYTSKPIAGYYAFYAWSRLLDYGTQVRLTEDMDDVYAVAARKSDGKLAIYVTRYNEDNNVTSDKAVTIEIPGYDIRGAISHITDSVHMYTEMPVETKDGKIVLYLEPESFALIEL